MFEINNGKIAQAQKVVIYGVEGIGKSTFASKFPKPLFIDLEGSTNNMDVDRLQTPSSWTIFGQMIDWVKREKPCKTLIIDTADYLEENLCKPYVVSTIPNANGQFVKNIESYGYGAGYKNLAEIWGKEFLNKASELVKEGINVVIIAHATQRRTDLPDQMGSYDRYELKLEKKTAALTKEWADLILFLNYQTEIIVAKDGMTKKNKGQGQKRVMYASHHAAYDAKNRHGLDEDYYTLDYNHIKHIFDTNEAKEKPKEEKIEESNVEKTKIEEAKELTLNEQIEKDFESLKSNENKRLPFDADPDDIALEQVQNKELKELMMANHITVSQIQKAIHKRGHFPESTNINDLPKDYVDGVLIGAFNQMKEFIIKENL